MHCNTCSKSSEHVLRLKYLFNNMPFRDNKGQTPYIIAPDKDTRNVFRKYMGENPDRYDYKKAQVKSVLVVCIPPNNFFYLNGLQFTSFHLDN